MGLGCGRADSGKSNVLTGLRFAGERLLERIAGEESLAPVDLCKHAMLRLDQWEGGARTYTCVPPPEYLGAVRHCGGTFSGDSLVQGRSVVTGWEQLYFKVGER